MEFDAVILAGGRSSRLGGVPKSGLIHDGATLLAGALRSARGAVAVAVVGPDPGPLPRGVVRCREDPPFAGQPPPSPKAWLRWNAAAAPGPGPRTPLSWPLTCPGQVPPSRRCWTQRRKHRLVMA
ncbi:MAG: NTP transferase domain-containing protein [Arthrobacter sp.]